MISLEEWNARIDAFVEEENQRAGRQMPVQRIYCQDDSDRSGGGLYNETVTVDTIGRFARALGDSNPLYSAPEYAGGSVWKGIVAPPLLECCICSTFIGGRMPRLRGLQVFDAGTKWERFVPIRPGDTFSAVTTWKGVDDITKPGKEAQARLLLRSHEINLYNQRGDHVSRLTARSIIKCSAPGGEQRKAEIKAGARPRYSEAQLKLIYENLEAQLRGDFRRGSEKRFVEDVKIGEDLPAQIVGPYDESDGQSLMAAIGAANAFSTKWGTIRGRRGTGGVVDPETGARRHPIDRHISDAAARAQGLPRAIASGIHAQALLAKLISDWMGDAGFLRSLDCRCRRPLYYGDLSIQRGKVLHTYEENGEYLVVLQVEAVNQDGVLHTEAEALVALPGGEAQKIVAK